MKPIKWVCDIIKTSLALDDDQVVVYDQKFDIPPDERMYVAVGVTSAKPFGSSRYYSGDTEVQSVNMLASLFIDVQSRSNDAFERKEEIIMALKSTYAQQIQEANSFALAIIPQSIVNLSMLEGPAICYRFQFAVNVQYLVTKTGTIDFFDSFQSPQLTMES